MKMPKKIKDSKDVRDSKSQAVVNTDKEAYNKRIAEKNRVKSSHNDSQRISRVEIQLSRLSRKVDELTKALNAKNNNAKKD